MLVEVALHQISERAARSLRVSLSDGIAAARHFEHRLDGYGARRGQTKIARITEMLPTRSSLSRIDGVERSAAGRLHTQREAVLLRIPHRVDGRLGLRVLHGDVGEAQFARRAFGAHLRHIQGTLRNGA
jgi:hypothetical protein